MRGCCVNRRSFFGLIAGAIVGACAQPMQLFAVRVRHQETERVIRISDALIRDSSIDIERLFAEQFFANGMNSIEREIV